MIADQLSGIPHTQIVLADSDGICVRLASWTVSIQVSAKNPVRVYWSKRDFESDENGLTVSGDENDDKFSLNATVANVWLRGIGGETEVTVTSIGIG